MKTGSIRSDIALTVATLFWGLTFPLIKICMAFMDPIPFLAIRFSLGAAILFVLFGGRIAAASAKLWRDGAIIGLILFIGNFLQYEGLKYTSASNSAFISSISVLLVPLIVAFLSGKLPGTMVVIGVTMAAVGMIFVCNAVYLTAVPPFIVFTTTPASRGDILTFLCALVFAIYLLVCDRFASRHDSLALNAVHLAAVSVLAFVLWPLMPNQRADILNWNVIIIIIYCAVFATAVAYLIMLKAQRYTDPTHVAMIFALEPVFAAVFAMFIPDAMGNVEIMTASAVFGSALIAGGIVSGAIRRGRRQITETPAPAGGAGGLSGGSEPQE